MAAQGGSGRTIMTAEPKFVPEDAVAIELDTSVRASVRLIDSVGYMIPGVNGQYEDGEERLVTTRGAITKSPCALRRRGHGR